METSIESSRLITFPVVYSTSKRVPGHVLQVTCRLLVMLLGRRLSPSALPTPSECKHEMSTFTTEVVTRQTQQPESTQEFVEIRSVRLTPLPSTPPRPTQQSSRMRRSRSNGSCQT